MLNTASGLKIVLLTVVDSTNNYAAKLLSEGKLTHGTVILAEKQTSGRGQRGNTWQSSENQFTGSFYAETAFLTAEKLPYLNFAVANAVGKTIHSLAESADVKIKWPNDIMVNDKKLGGVLIETQWSGSAMRGAVIGIGINLKSEQLPSACSLEDIGIQTNKTTLAVSIWEEIGNELLMLQAGMLNDISSTYHSFLWKKGGRQTATLPGGSTIEGTINGVSPQGDLLFETENGVQSFQIKEIAFNY